MTLDDIARQVFLEAGVNAENWPKWGDLEESSKNSWRQNARAKRERVRFELFKSALQGTSSRIDPKVGPATEALEIANNAVNVWFERDFS